MTTWGLVIVLGVGIGVASALGTASAADASPSRGICIAATGSNGWCGDRGPATRAKLAVPRDVAPLPGGGFLIADSVNHVIRRVNAGGTITTVAGTGIAGNPQYGDRASVNELGTPAGVALQRDGGYLIADSALGEVLRVTPGGRLVAAAGRNVGMTTGDGGPASGARLRLPRDVVVLPDGGYAISDAGDHRVRRVLPDGTIMTLAGTGAAGFSGDGGPAAAARLSQPMGLAVASDGAVLVADRGNARIRRIAADGTISTVAGGGAGTTPALDATLTSPSGAAATPDGGFLVAEAAVIRRIGPDGAIATVGGTGKAGFNTRSKPATKVAVAYPAAIAVMADGRALIADTLNDRVRLLDTAGSTLTTIAGRDVPGPPGRPEPAPDATLRPPAAPSPSAPIVTMQDQPPATSRPAVRARRRGRSNPPFLKASRTYCATPSDDDPRAFGDLHLIPLLARVLTARPRVRFRFAVDRDVTVIARLMQKGRTVRSSGRRKVPAGSRRSLALRGRAVRPGLYRLALQATSRENLRRCHALRLRVRR